MGAYLYINRKNIENSRADLMLVQTAYGRLAGKDEIPPFPEIITSGVH